MTTVRIYKPDDKLNFGKYKGEDLRFIFTFDPEYIQWLIINNEHFAIDINDFKDRHSSQVDIEGVTSGERFGFVSVQVKGDTEIRRLSLRQYLEEFFTNEYQSHYLDKPEKITLFKFSDESLAILKTKI